MGGTPVRAGTRVPILALLDYLEAGGRLDDFLDELPTVTREQAVAFLGLAKKAAVAVRKYDVYVTVDRNLTFQQNLQRLRLVG